MPTAGEYKHEPSGIPCHCYVRRRIHHSLCPWKKSCLRKSYDQQAPCKSNKKVTFDRVLRVRSYEGNDYFKYIIDNSVTECSPTTPNITSIFDDEKVVPSEIKPQIVINKNEVDNDWSLRNTITSFFTFRKGNNIHSEKNARTNIKYSKLPVSYKGTRDGNNNFELFSQKSEVDMNESRLYVTRGNTGEKGDSCKLNSSNRPLKKYHESKTKDWPSNKKGLSSSSGWEYNGDHAKNTAIERPPYYGQQPQLLRKNEQISNRLNNRNAESQNQNNDNAEMGHDLKDTSVSHKIEQNKIGLSNEDDPSEKSDEYIYAAPDNQNRIYEYIPVKSSNIRRRTESENLDSSLTIPAFEASACYISSMVKHKTEGDLRGEITSVDISKRQNTVTPQSAPNLHSIVTTPYHIKFLNECIKAYVDRDSMNERNDAQSDIFPEIQKTEQLQINSLNPKSNVVTHSLFKDISRIMPIVMFWTGSAFLVGLIYIFLFSCSKYDE
ncbi:hypothetical protein PGB90_001486 [Kerria lacca]